VRNTPAGLLMDTLVLGNGNARIAGSASIPASAPVRAHLRAERMPLADIGVLAQLSTPIAGRLGFDLEIAGTRAAPTLALSGAADSLTVGGLTAEAMRVSGRYGSQRAAMDATLVRGGRSILDASVDYPIALSLFAAKATADSLRGRIHADSVDLALVEALSPKLKNATGRLALDLVVSGQPAHPHVGGLATVRNGTIEIPSVGIRFSGIEMRLAVDPQRDSLTIDQLRWASPASGGNASVAGSVVFRDVHDPRFDLRLDARGLRAVDKSGLARLDVSTGASGLTLRGTQNDARMSGAVNVNRGTIYIPELVNKRLEEFTQEEFADFFDTTDVRNRSLMPQPPARLVEHLQLDGVSVNVGDEVWLRSAEANIKLGGSLNVARARDERETRRSTLGRAGADAVYRLALSGALSADRGTYTLDLGVVQREFQVQSGRITFFGTADFNPSIDVSALYRVKQSRRADIGVKARIVGPFYPQPALELSSDDAYISQTDLVAYLVTGRPSVELAGSNADAAQRAAEVLLPTGGALLSRALREQFGGWVDLFQIQTGTLSDASSVSGSAGSTSAQNQFRSVLSGTRLGGEKQISDRLFLSFSTGLCQLGSSNDKEQQGVTGFVNSIEGKLEYRFPVIAPDQLSLRAGREPAASALRCGSGSVRGFVATPQQWGLSLFRSWSF
jgi:translocation and assembly module TamB